MKRRSAFLYTLMATTSALGCLPRPTPRASYEAHAETMVVPSYVIFQDSAGALSYHAPTARDATPRPVQERVEGKACQRGLQLPVFTGNGIAMLSVGFGEGAYRQATDDARQLLPAGALLYDVRADLQARTILLLYREECLIVNAAVHRPTRL